MYTSNHVQTPLFNDLRNGMKLIIAEAVSDACAITNDMSIDDLKYMSIDSIRQNAFTVIHLSIDPDSSVVDIPKIIIDATNEYINTHLHFSPKVNKYLIPGYRILN